MKQDGPLIMKKASNGTGSWGADEVRRGFEVEGHQAFLQSRQFCRHNLFSLNTVTIKLNDLWWRRYNNLRFVVPHRLRGVDGGPVSPEELEDRVFAQCEEARTVLLKRWLPEVAMVFVKQRKAWASLVPR